MGKNLNLKTKMLAFILLPTLFAFIVSGYLSYYNSKNAINLEIKESLHEMVGSTAADIQNWLESKEALANNVAAMMSAGQLSDADIVQVLQKLPCTKLQRSVGM